MGYYLYPVGLLVVTLLSGIYLSRDEEVRNNAKFNMAQTKTAFVLGGTGAVGKEIIKALAESTQYTRVTIIGRRQVKLPEPNEDPRYNKFDEQIIDFDKPQDYQDAFKGYDVGFSSLGTTRAKSGAAGFYTVDHDYVVNTAKAAKAGGTRHFHLVSSTGANKDSYFLYPKTKGEVEEELKSLGFQRLSIYRPALLLTNAREETRFGESIARALIGTLDRCRWLSVETSVLARVMVANTFTKNEDPIETLDNKGIIGMGKTLKEQEQQHQ